MISTLIVKGIALDVGDGSKVRTMFGVKNFIDKGSLLTSLEVVIISKVISATVDEDKVTVPLEVAVEVVRVNPVGELGKILTVVERMKAKPSSPIRL